ncbi:MAG: hypothetical protein K5989_02800 [Lachnospiraceae bacterium]|nr:hypothetical protein [Lachnospiraceae bacterium]
MLTDDQLEHINGGFGELASGGTKGMNIVCPSCAASNKSDFSNKVLKDAKTGSLEYKCNKCNTSFICYDGYVILKSDWINLCNKKGHKYPFA